MVIQRQKEDDKEGDVPERVKYEMILWKYKLISCRTAGVEARNDGPNLGMVKAEDSH